MRGLLHRLVARQEGALEGRWADFPKHSCWSIYSDIDFTGLSQGVDVHHQESQLVVIYGVSEAAAL